MKTKLKTQREVAMALGISEVTLSRYLSGKSRAKGGLEAQRLVGAALAIGAETNEMDWLIPRYGRLRKVLGL